MKNVAVLGGGIAGMSAAITLADEDVEKDCQITIFSKDLGGEYLSGGLKFLHATEPMVDFVMDVMRMPVHIEKVNGAVAWDHVIHQHPEFFWFTPELGRSIQRQYWRKTRGGAKAGFRNTCMNEPWRYRNELKLVPQGGISSLIRNMENYVTHKNQIRFEYQDIDVKFVKDVIEHYDYVVYTIPIKILGEAFGFKPDFEYRPLNIVRHYVIDGSYPLWMDYIYIPSNEYVFHRISFFKDDAHRLVMDVEINGDKGDQFKPIEIESVNDNIIHFLDKFFPNLQYEFSESHFVPVKGHIKSDPGGFEIPKNVFLLGRYAQWDGRVTFDKVLEGAAQISERIEETTR